jgi:hypothetical protein
LLVTKSESGFEVEIVDFKTNRIRKQAAGGRRQDAGGRRQVAGERRQGAGGTRQEAGIDSRRRAGQFAFDFDALAAATTSSPVDQPEISVADQVRITATDYQLQMQAYALAVTELIDALMPGLKQTGFSIKSTLHFLDPNVEFHLSGDLLSPQACALAIDDAMMDIVSSVQPEQFPVRPAMHCRMCNFLGICPAGREWVRSTKNPTSDELSMAAVAIQNRAL